MLLGVLADSHGRPEATASAVSVLLAQGAELLLHLGDIGSEGVLDELVGHPARIVFGNCDWNREALMRHARAMGVQVDHPMGVAEVAGKRVAFTHGDDGRLMQQALAEGVDYLLHGHTHVLRDERRGDTRIINPGALFRAPRYTAALLDPANDRLQIIEVPRSDA